MTLARTSQEIHYYYLFWYCERHDDAYYTIRLPPLELYENWPENLCGFGKCDSSDVMLIGYRTYTKEYELIDDTTHEFNFDKRSGGYEWEYLDLCDLIGDDPLNL